MSYNGRQIKENEVELTFRKDFECTSGFGTNHANIMPYTTEGKRIANVLSCAVESNVDSLPVMTLKVQIVEHVSQQVAARLTK